MPAHYEGEGDDRLMNSIISKYAIETRDKDGKPSGKFFLDQSGARAIAEEVVGTHLKKDAAGIKTYLDEKFPEAWGRFDVNGEGKIEAMRGPTFLRYIVGSVEAGFGLQAQVHAKK
tara:strand:- start:65 stop:412 length:348 start_codon:yes stop_codon:yes gene_type:complete